MRLPRRFIPLLCATLFALLSANGQAPTQSLPLAEWSAPARLLAAKIADAVKPAKIILLNVENKSSLDESDVNSIHAALASELGRLNLAVQSPPPTSSGPSSSEGAATVQLILSQGADGYVWIAQARNASSQQIAMVSVIRNSGLALAPTAPTLHRRIVLQQPEPILDFAPSASATPLSWYVLRADSVVSYHTAAGNSGLAQDPPIAIRNVPKSRDLRGRLMIDPSDGFTILMGAATCTQSTGEGFLFCGANPPARWPIGGAWYATYDSSHNYFESASLSSGASPQTLPAFFSAATLESGDVVGTPQIILAELDGRARLYSGSSPAAASVFSGWGEEIATLSTNCDRDWHVLVTGFGDWTERDYIQMYRIAGGQAVAEGERLDFPGPILSLWAPPNERAVRVISRNLSTGMYEASLVSASCGS